MNQDVQKFTDLLKTDESLQEKMSAAWKNYTGEQTPEAAFQHVILPIAEEAGCHFTWEDYQHYMQVAVKDLDLDEMEQVAGGDSTRGTVLSACVGIGIGGGVTVKVKDDGSGCSLSTICFFVGFGETAACAYAGASTDVNKDIDPHWRDWRTGNKDRVRDGYNCSEVFEVAAPKVPVKCFSVERPHCRMRMDTADVHFPDLQ